MNYLADPATKVSRAKTVIFFLKRKKEMGMTLDLSNYVEIWSLHYLKEQRIMFYPSFVSATLINNLKEIYDYLNIMKVSELSRMTTVRRIPR